MKLGQFILYYKGKKFTKKFYKNCNLKISARSFCVCKDSSTAYFGKLHF